MTEDRIAKGSMEESRYSKYNSYNSGFNYEARLHYNPDFWETLKDILTLNTFIGTARSENRYETAGGFTNGGLVVPNFYSIANSRQKSTAYSQSTWKRTNSVYGMASLGYKGTALYLDPNEAWAEYRRTGYPKTLIQVGDVVNLNIPKRDENGTTRTTYTFTSLEADINEIPDRIGYPLTYTGLNVANYQQAVRNMGMNSDSRTHRLIFAQKRPALPRR